GRPAIRLDGMAGRLYQRRAADAGHAGPSPRVRLLQSARAAWRYPCFDRACRAADPDGHGAFRGFRRGRAHQAAEAEPDHFGTRTALALRPLIANPRKRVFFRLTPLWRDIRCLADQPINGIASKEFPVTALSAFLRKPPGEALREYFARPDAGLPPAFDSPAPDADLSGPRLGAIEKMSRVQRDRISNDADRVHALSDEPGQAAIYSVAEDPALLDGLANPHARSLWMFLNAQDRFRHAEEVRFTEDRRRGRMWAGYMTAAGCVVQRDASARHAFVSAIKEFSGAAHAHVDIFDRVRTTHEGDECDLVQ